MDRLELMDFISKVQEIKEKIEKLQKNVSNE